MAVNIRAINGEVHLLLDQIVLLFAEDQRVSKIIHGIGKCMSADRHHSPRTTNEHEESSGRERTTTEWKAAV